MGKVGAASGRPTEKAPPRRRPEPRRAPARPPVAGQDHAQGLRLLSGVAPWLPNVAVGVQLLRAPGTSRSCHPTPSSETQTVSACRVLFCFSLKGQCFISEFESLGLAQSPPLKPFLPSFGSLRKQGARDCSSQSQSWRSQSVQRIRFSPSLSSSLPFSLPLFSPPLPPPSLAS